MFVVDTRISRRSSRHPASRLSLLCTTGLLVAAAMASEAQTATERLVGPPFSTIGPGGPKAGANDCKAIPCPLSHAVQQAHRGDTVRILSGPVEAHDVVVNKDLTITAATCPSRIRIDANGQGRHFDIANAQPATVTLSCLNLVDGVDAEGGAIRVGARGALVFDNGKISGASAARDGGAIFNAGGLVTVLDSELTDNRASPTGGGGAIMSEGGSVTVRRSEVSGNRAQTGGAIAGQNSAVVVTASTLSENQAVGGDGGALWLHSGTLLVGNTVLEANTADGHRGGAVYASASDLTIQANATLVENAAATGGAIGTVAGSTVTIDATTFSGNTAAQDGGALLRENFGHLTIRESTFEGNSASRGGALADLPGTLNSPEITTTIRRSSFAENEAGSLGGAIYHLAANGSLHVVNSTFSTNRAATDGAGIFNGAGGEISIVFSTFVGNDVTAGNNLAGGAFSNEGGARVYNSIITASEPRGCASVPLGLAGDNNLAGDCNTDVNPSGTVFNRGQVIGLLALGNTYALSHTSNAIDLGRRTCTDEILGERVTEDQSGTERPVDGDGDGIAKCDIGASEFVNLRVEPDLDQVGLPGRP
jgi:predicted outer membrane repeat protein